MLQDTQSFQCLWQKFAEQQFEEGSLALPNERNLEFHTSLFYDYVGGQVPGLVLLVSDGSKDVGLHMEGVIRGGLELSIGRYTMLWGDYLLPAYRGQGISHKLYEAAMKWTYEQGFTGGITGILVGDKSVPQILEKVVDGTHGASKTRPYTIEVCWEFERPTDSS
jgi:GNAT superfamily N-acetyltransferase